MATALFVTEEKIKSFTGIDENVDPAMLYPYVLQAQDFWIQQTCGTKLYEKLKEYVVDFVQNATPIPTDYKKLLDDYVAPTVIHFAYYQALPQLKYKATNKGVMSGTSEVASTISLEELQYLRNSIFDSAKFYNERLRDYLRAYQELYVEYQSYTDKDGMQPNKGTSYYTGLAIPKRKYNYCDDCEDSEGQANYPIY
jgi:hypothetical protein